MIEVSFNREHETISLKLSGHAGSGFKGHDIVCAAASILAYTIAQIVDAAYVKNDLRERPIVHMKEGSVLIRAKPKKEKCKEMEHAFLVVQTGYELLMHNYPDCVHVNLFGKAKTA